MAETTITWFGHSCFELRTPGGKVVLLDPWFANPTSPRSPDLIEECDVMLVTHGHFDHFGNAMPIAARTRPVWPAMHELQLWLGSIYPRPDDVIGFNKGGTVDARGLKVTMTHADHSAGDWSGAAGVSLDLGEPVGFVIEQEDGLRIYYAGDTDVFGDMALIAELHRPDMAFLPIGGHYTMGPRGAAKAAQLLGVKAVVPIHYGTFPVLVGTPDELRREIYSLGVEVEVLAPERGVETALP